MKRSETVDMGILSRVVVTALATWQIVEIWRHSSMPFIARWRASLEAEDSAWSEIARCPFCLSPWVAGTITCILHLVDYPGGWSLLLVPVEAFAASRLANLANDFFHSKTRTPGHNTDEGNTE